MMNSKYWGLGVFLNSNCFSNQTIRWLLSQASNYRLYDELHHWLVLGCSLDTVVNLLDDSAFGPSTDFVIAVPSTLVNYSYEMYDIYNPWKSRGGQLSITRIGMWTKTYRLQFSSSGSKFRRRTNLRGMNLRASFFGSQYRHTNVPLEAYLQEFTGESKDGLSKFGYTILVHLSEMFNITMKFGEVQKWMEGDTEGPLTRALDENKIDIIGSPIIMTVERLGLTKFVYPTWPFRTCFIFRNPQPKNIKIMEILCPFELDSWYGTMVMFLLAAITLAFTLRYEGKELFTMRYSNAFLIAFGALCQQGTHFDIKKISTRIVFMHIMIFSLLTYNYYSASIVSARLNEPIVKINDSLNELAKTNLKFASEPMIYFDFLIKKEDWETKNFYVNRWSHIPESEQFMYPKQGMELVQQGGFAYHTHSDIGYPIILRNYNYRKICELMEVHLQAPVFATMALPYNSTLVEITKIGFARMSEVGIRHRQIQRWSSNKPHFRKDVLNVSSTNIYEFSPHLLTLIGGIALASIMLICEIFIERCLNNKRLPTTVCTMRYTNGLSWVLRSTK
ncbi:ionotropic receptor 75a isoform X2 [Nasonia vitripennis]|uniref:Uncharacterized protein n=1 Tax=Nasonia vitripennis TaxID=7425 RepID=A0A7M7PY77_NASVI|nr:ionotropic receptor 75a isoform X2 [Nasonia vitripennis]